MRNSHLAVILGIWLAVAACSKATQDKTGQDLGSDIKQGTEEAAAKTKVAAGEAGEKLKAGAEKAGSDLKSGAKTAGDKTDAALNKAAADVKK
jgi:hypothetical protein